MKCPTGGETGLDELKLVVQAKEASCAWGVHESNTTGIMQIKAFPGTKRKKRKSDAERAGRGKLRT